MKEEGDEENKIKNKMNPGIVDPLTVISFPLLAVGARDAQDAVDGVGANRVVGGAGHRRRGRVGH